MDEHSSDLSMHTTLVIRPEMIRVLRPFYVAVREPNVHKSTAIISQP